MLCRAFISRLRTRACRLSSFALLAFLLGTNSAHAIIDLNHNGMSDIWERLYGVWGVDPAADPDADGFSNLQESIADTDPFDPLSFPPDPYMDLAATNFSVTIPCSPGKQYQLQGSSAPGQTNWTIEETIVARSGPTITLAAPM